MNFALAFTFIALLHLTVAVPLPQVVTRVHTAEAVTTTKTYVTGTTTVWLPPVEILISDGVRYTITQYDGDWAEEQVTVTSVFNKNVNIGPFTSGVGEAIAAGDATTTTTDTMEEKATVLATTPSEVPVTTLSDHPAGNSVIIPVTTPFIPHIVTPADSLKNIPDEVLASPTDTDVSTKTTYDMQTTSDSSPTAYKYSFETSSKPLAAAYSETSASENVHPTDTLDDIRSTPATQEFPTDKPHSTSSSTEATTETSLATPTIETTSSTTKATPETMSTKPAIETSSSTTEATPETSSAKSANEATSSTTEASPEPSLATPTIETTSSTSEATSETSSTKPTIETTSSTTEATHETSLATPIIETTSATAKATPETSSTKPAIETSSSTTEATPETSSSKSANEATSSTSEATSEPSLATPTIETTSSTSETSPEPSSAKPTIETTSSTTEATSETSSAKPVIETTSSTTEVTSESSSAKPTIETTSSTTEATSETSSAKPAIETTSSTTEATSETSSAKPTIETTSSTTEATFETSSTKPAIETTSSTSEATPETTSPKPTIETTPLTPATKTADPTQATTQSTSAASGFIQAPSGIAYSPYLNSGGCKGYDVIDSDLQLIKSKGISKIRLYGADCLVIDAVLPLCMKHGITVNQGFWISPAGVDSIDEYVSSVVSWAKINGWGVFDFFTVGNEAINNAWVTVPELIAKIASVKSILNNAGYSGRISTSEPPISFIRNPSLCTESVIDIVGVNTHSYFNTDLFAYQAGEYVASQQAQVAQVCGKPTMTTETGYPHKGDTYGNNVPSDENQLIALQSIMKSTGGDVTILTTFDDFWKPPGPHDIEQYFGMINLVQP